MASLNFGPQWYACLDSPVLCVLASLFSLSTRRSLSFASSLHMLSANLFVLLAIYSLYTATFYMINTAICSH
ncbi:hypothetical protein BKA69DRAFT_1086779 [Paraphysoderma sedebokerense]|nr:hypothetical protein BKA69DRAFT_1086779 [Paraphysoderma sedebokerense]